MLVMEVQAVKRIWSQELRQFKKFVHWDFNNKDSFHNWS